MEEIAGGRSIDNLPLCLEKVLTKLFWKGKMPENLNLIEKNFLSMETSFSEWKLYLRLRMELFPLQIFGVMSLLQSSWLEAQALHRLTWVVGLGISFLLRPVPGSSVVLCVKKERALQCGDGGNLSLVSSRVGLSLLLLLWIDSFCLLQQVFVCFSLPHVFHFLTRWFYVFVSSELHLTWSCVPLLTCSWSVRSHSLSLLQKLFISVGGRCSELWQ